MKILSRQTFLSLPVGTLFMEYEPIIFGPLCVKGDTIYGGTEEAIDFFYKDVVTIDAKSDSELIDVLEQSLGTDISLTANCYTRDGTFNEDQLYAVFDDRDKEVILNCIKG